MNFIKIYFYVTKVKERKAVGLRSCLRQLMEINVITSWLRDFYNYIDYNGKRFQKINKVYMYYNSKNHCYQHDLKVIKSFMCICASKHLLENKLVFFVCSSFFSKRSSKIAVRVKDAWFKLLSLSHFACSFLDLVVLNL